MVELHSISENVINILWLKYLKSRHIRLTFGSESNWEFQVWVPGSQIFHCIISGIVYQRPNLNVTGVSLGPQLAG